MNKYLPWFYYLPRTGQFDDQLPTHERLLQARRFACLQPVLLLLCWSRYWRHFYLLMQIEDYSLLNHYYFINYLANLITCPDGLVFSEKTGTCSWPGEANRVGCQSSGTFQLFYCYYYCYYYFSLFWTRCRSVRLSRSSPGCSGCRTPCHQSSVRRPDRLPVLLRLHQR